MADDSDKRGKADRSRINVNEEHEVRYWTERFSISSEQLKTAVQSVGLMAKDVAKALGKPYAQD